MRGMAHKIKEEPFSRAASPASAPSPPLSQPSALVVKVDSSGRAIPVSHIKASTSGLGAGKTPFMKIVRRVAAPAPSQASGLGASVKSEPTRRVFDPTALARPIKVQPSKPRFPMVKTELPSSTSAPAASASSSSEIVREFDVRAPKLGRRRFSVLRFQGGMDFTKCTSAQMQRQNNLRDFKSANDIADAPKSGAGSEYRREQREEARRKKYGLKLREYNPHEQPWLLQFQPQVEPKPEVKSEVKVEVKSEKKVEVKTEKKVEVKSEKKVDAKKKEASGPKRFRGHREGSISDNVTYFVFTQCKDGAFEAFPIAAWYNMTPELRYRYLNTDEAEVEFARRGKIHNYLNFMFQRRLMDAAEEGEGGGEGGGGEGKEEKREGAGEGGGAVEMKGKEALSEVTRAAIARARRGDSRKAKGGGAAAKKRRSNLQLTEMDEWLDEDEDEREEEEGGEDGEGTEGPARGPRRGPGGRKKVRRGAGRKSRKRAMEDDGSEVEDDSEPDDREGEEVDYMTHSSSDEEKLSADEREEIYAEKGVEEEGGLKGLLTDASSEDEEEEQKKDENAADGGASSSAAGGPSRRKESERPAGKGVRGQAARGSDSSSSSSSSSEDDSDSELEKEAAKVRPILSRLPPLSASPAAPEASSASGEATEPAPNVSRKREGAPVAPDGDTGGTETGSSSAKRFKASPSLAVSAGSGAESGVTEDAIRRYLQRKPMTAKDLLRKFSRRLPQLRKCEISKQIARLLQKMKVQKRNHNGITLLSLASS